MTLPHGNKVVDVLVSSGDLVDYLKRRIHKEHLGNMKLEHLSLEFRSQKLEDSKQLSDYDMEEGDMIQVKNSSPTQTIKVKTLNGVVRDIFDVHPTETVGDFAQRVQDSLDIPVHLLRLIYSGKQLQFDHTIDDYGIKDGDMIHVVQRLRGD